MSRSFSKCTKTMEWNIPPIGQKEIQTHPVYTLQEQLKMFDTSKGKSQAQGWELLIANFLHANGRIKDAELVKVQEHGLG